MKPNRIEVIYDPSTMDVDVQSFGEMSKLEIIAMLSMAISKVVKSPAAVTESNVNLDQLQRELQSVAIDVELGDMIARRVFKHPSRPTNMWQLRQVKRSHLERIVGMGTKSLTKIQNYFAQKGIYWE